MWPSSKVEVINDLDGDVAGFHYGTEHFYGRDTFQPSDFAELAQRLGKLKGRFVLSLNDHPDVREMFGAFDVEPVPVT